MIFKMLHLLAAKMRLCNSIAGNISTIPAKKLRTLLKTTVQLHYATLLLAGKSISFPIPHASCPQPGPSSSAYLVLHLPHVIFLLLDAFLLSGDVGLFRQDGFLQRGNLLAVPSNHLAHLFLLLPSLLKATAE